ncbi:MAG: AAA family ATPase [Gammaproteobacteria bacterium]
MYLELFKLDEFPFRLSPDPQFVYWSKQHSRAKAYMESTIWLTDGFVVITGEIGSGKTTLIQSFLSELEDDVVFAQVSQTQISPVQFLQAVLVEFGFQPFKKRKAELLDMLNMYLIEQFAEGRKVVLIIDEAQNLSTKVLEEIRLLSGVETHKEKVLRIILAGQPELNRTLDSPELVQLAQRVRLRFHLGPLTSRETRAYIQHRLDIAGARGREIFTEETHPIITRYCGGIPRLINTLCDTALLCAYADETDVVTAEYIESAIEELQWVEFSERTSRFMDQRTDPSMSGSLVIGKLLVAQNGQATGEVPITPGRLIIGRTPDNDVRLNSKFVSRHHAQIITDMQHSILEDLNSTNGVYVRQQRIKKHRLRDGDIIQIGKHEVRYVDERGALSQRIVNRAGGE